MFFDNLIVIGQQVLVLFLLIAVGFICGKLGVITEHASKKMTDIVLYIVTPCVMISAFQRDFSMEMLGKVLVAALTAAVILAASIGLAKLVIHSKDESRRKVLQFAVVFSNCGFMSLPLQKQLLGEDGWFFGSILVAVFNLFVWSYGLADMSGSLRSFSPKKLLLNPGILGVAAAMILFMLRVRLPDILAQPIGHLANLNTPIPMLIIGFYLSQANLKRAFTDPGAYLAMALRLIVIPAAAIFAMAALRLDRTMTIAFAIACSAPTAATTTMFAAKFDRDTQLSVSTVASSTLVSVITMPLMVSLAYLVCGL